MDKTDGLESSKPELIGRIAPTPSGFLHLGNAFNFILSWLILRSKSAKILLRVDDIDVARTKPAYISNIFETIDWLGLDFDSGPTGPDDLAKNWSQVDRMAMYRELYEVLQKTDKLFACSCSRTQIRAVSPNGLYLGTCRELGLDFKEGVAARVKTGEAVESWMDQILGQIHVPLAQHMPDFMLWKKDDSPGYQLSSVADDIYYRVNVIVRGSDLVNSTAAQLFLAKQIPTLASFAGTRFYHHPLLLKRGAAGVAGEKLSKSVGVTQAALSVRLQNQFKSAEQVFQAFSQWAGLPECGNAAEALATFAESSLDFTD